MRKEGRSVCVLVCYLCGCVCVYGVRKRESEISMCFVTVNY